MVCNNCMFSHCCNRVPFAETRFFNNGDADDKSCHYWHLSQNIVTRHGQLQGVKVLSRPINSIEHFCNKQSCFSSLNQDKHKRLLNEIVNKIHHNHTERNPSYFINIERISLLDTEVVNRIMGLNDYLTKQGTNLTVEITARHPELSKFTKEAKYKLKDSGVNIALGKFDANHFDIAGLAFYDYVKFDCQYVLNERNKGINGYQSDFIHFLFNIVEMGVSTIAEKVETKAEYDFITSLPFTHLQGGYDNTKNDG